MSGSVKSVIFILSTIGLWGVWDIYVLMAYGESSTLSEVIMGWSRQSPVGPLFLGYLAGHWYPFKK